ncbi:MAG: glycosyltransferase family 87 protein [Candidatus Aminicenantes bacterium]|nr:glycosyltransferase family 87 protein [Candidatus Aminicenantes bacterium]
MEEIKTKAKLVRNLSLFILGAIVLLLVVQMLGKVDRASGNDFTSYLSSSRALWQGGDPYKTESSFPYTYPLFLAFVLIPLSSLAEKPASLIWFALNACAFAYSCKVLINFLPQAWRDRARGNFWPLLLILSVLIFDVLQNHFLNGQVNLIVLALMILFIHHDIKSNNFKAAVFLSLAISIKVVPLILIMYLFFRKKFDSIVCTFLFISFWVFSPAVVAGNRMISYYQGYFQQFILKRVGSIGKMNASHVEFSLQYFLKKTTHGIVPDFYLLILSVLLVTFPIIVLELVSLKKNWRENRLWIFSLYLVAILLISPMSEVHHLVFFIPALFLCSMAVLYRTVERSIGQLLFLAATFSFLILAGLCRANVFYFVALGLGYFMVLFLSRTMAMNPSRDKLIT